MIEPEWAMGLMEMDQLYQNQDINAQCTVGSINLGASIKQTTHS